LTWSLSIHKLAGSERFFYPKEVNGQNKAAPMGAPMHIDAVNADLRNISLNLIDKNPENPRIVFRPGELEDLLESIRRYGVQVPISVYREKGRFVLIDGERRWRCCLKLGKKEIPALVQDKPDPLTNLLLMFNIHALREQWDLLTIAIKLPRVIELLSSQLSRPPNEREISQHTGLPRGLIRRCKLLMELPQRYKDTILDELNKPKSQQKLTEDFFIEMERALTTASRAMPEVLRNRDSARQVLISKYKSGVIVNILDFRKISKIARAERVAADRTRALNVLLNLFNRNQYSIEQAYQDSVYEAYSERDLLTRIHSLLEKLKHIRESELDEDLRRSLQELISQARSLLGTRQ
jgi:ParB family chromosome partitioning protein